MTEFIDFIGYHRAQPAVLNSKDCITDKKNISNTMVGIYIIGIEYRDKEMY